MKKLYILACCVLALSLATTQVQAQTNNASDITGGNVTGSDIVGGGGPTFNPSAMNQIAQFVFNGRSFVSLGQPRTFTLPNGNSREVSSGVVNAVNQLLMGNGTAPIVSTQLGAMLGGQGSGGDYASLWGQRSQDQAVQGRAQLRASVLPLPRKAAEPEDEVQELIDALDGLLVVLEGVERGDRAVEASERLVIAWQEWGEFVQHADPAMLSNPTDVFLVIHAVLSELAEAARTPGYPR